MLTSCAYRFSNEHIKIPVGVQTIAFEAIYDTTREVIPHHILWASLQRAFAEDGHLRVVSQGRADVLLRAHVTSANVAPTGGSVENGPQEDPKVDFSSDKNISTHPSEFRPLTQAGNVTQKELVSIGLSVEIINLHTGITIFSNSYQRSEKFSSERGANQVQPKSMYLLYEEALAERFRRISDNIADNVRRDFILGR